MELLEKKRIGLFCQEYCTAVLPMVAICSQKLVEFLIATQYTDLIWNFGPRLSDLWSFNWSKQDLQLQSKKYAGACWAHLLTKTLQSTGLWGRQDNQGRVGQEIWLNWSALSSRRRKMSSKRKHVTAFHMGEVPGIIFEPLYVGVWIMNGSIWIWLDAVIGGVKLSCIHSHAQPHPGVRMPWSTWRSQGSVPKWRTSSQNSYWEGNEEIDLGLKPSPLIQFNPEKPELTLQSGLEKFY